MNKKVSIYLYELAFYAYINDNYLRHRVIQEFFEEYCIYKDPSFKYMPSSIDFNTLDNNFYDGCIRFYNVIKNRQGDISGISAGMGYCNEFLRYLRKHNIGYELIEKRSEEYLNYEINNETPYQLELKEPLVFRDSVQQHLKLIYAKKRGLIAAAVNYGKSYVALDLFGKAGEGVYVVAQRGLVKQFKDLLLATFNINKKDICDLATNFKINYDAKFYVVSSDKMYNNYKGAKDILKNINKYDQKEIDEAKQTIDFIKYVLSRKVAYFDEIHDISRESMFELAKISKSPYKLGVSGTLDKRGKLTLARMYSIFGYKNILYKVKTSDLVQEGISANTCINIISFEPNSLTNNFYKLPNISLQNKNTIVDLYKINRQFAPDSVYLRAYQKLYKDYVIFGLNLNLICMNLALKKAFKENKVTVIYSDNLDHLLLLYLLFYEFTKQKQLPELFEQIKPIHGKLSNKERDRLVQELKGGKYKIALVSDILTTGYNIPNIECMFYLANKGASSLVTPLQFLGRGHRITKEKKYFEYYDLSVDLAYIDKANKNRIREYEKEGYNTKSIIMKTTDQLKDIVQKMYQNIVDSAEDLLNDPQLNNAFGVHMQTCFLHDIIKNKNRSSKPIINKKFSTDFKIL